MTTPPRYRRSSVRAVLESVTNDHAARAEAHDAVWAALWNRRYEDVDEPLWSPEASFSGIIAYARSFPEGTSLTGVDTGESFTIFRGIPTPPPIGSKVRVLPSTRDNWKLGDGSQSLGLGIILRFDDHAAAVDTAWIAQVRIGLDKLREALENQREGFAVRRKQLGALNEPPTVEDVWREELGMINDRVQMQTDYTTEEHALIAKARARGPRFADEEQKRIVAARRKRFSEKGAEAVATFRAEQWPAIRDAAAAEWKRYADYRTEVVRLEDAMQHMRWMHDRAEVCEKALEKIEQAEIRVLQIHFEPERVTEAAYAEETLRTIELLFAAIPSRGARAAATFSAYRASTHGPAIIPPRLM